jgi:hypothetical protein
MDGSGANGASRRRRRGGGGGSGGAAGGGASVATAAAPRAPHASNPATAHALGAAPLPSGGGKAAISSTTAAHLTGTRFADLPVSPLTKR